MLASMMLHGQRRFLWARVFLLALLGAAAVAGSGGGASRQAVIEGRLSHLKAKKAALEAGAPQPPDLDRAARVVLPAPRKPAESEAASSAAPETATDAAADEVAAAVAEAEASGSGGGSSVGEEATLEDDIDVLTPAGELALVMRVRADRAARAEVTRRFSSRAEREMLELARERVYASLLVSVRFPDGSRLEGRFHPAEDVSALYIFVKDYLSPELLKHPGLRLLFAAPAKAVLVGGTTLAAAGLQAPASVVHLGLADGAAAFPLGAPFLSDAARQLALAPLEAKPTASPKGTPLV